MGSRPTVPVRSDVTTTTGSGGTAPTAGGRPSVPPRPLPPIISRIATSPPVFAADTSDFSGYVQQQLGDLGTGTDGWDAVINPIVTALATEVASLGDFDTLLTSLAFNTGDFASTYFAPVDLVLPSFLEDGDALNSGVQNPGSIQGAPTIVAPPAPPTTGGGGVGGGTGGGGGDSGSGDIGEACFSPNAKVKTAKGDVSIGEFRSGDYVLTHFGPRPATLIEHEYSGPMLDMGGGELVTPDHLIRTGVGFEWMDFSPASDIWTSRVNYSGKVYTLHVTTHRSDEQHFKLANGHIAHNKPNECGDYCIPDDPWGE